MEYTKIFNINEIITIVMEEVRIEENNRMYGMNEEGDYPKYICDKFEMLNEEEFEEFMDSIMDITEQILQIKSGELNELNKCHEEIIYLAGKYLNKYIIN